MPVCSAWHVRGAVRASGPQGQFFVFSSHGILFTSVEKVSALLTTAISPFIRRDSYAFV